MSPGPCRGRAFSFFGGDVTWLPERRLPRPLVVHWLGLPERSVFLITRVLVLSFELRPYRRLAQFLQPIEPCNKGNKGPIMTTKAELACVYSALILADDDVAVTVSIITSTYPTFHPATLLRFCFRAKFFNEFLFSIVLLMSFQRCFSSNIEFICRNE